MNAAKIYIVQQGANSYSNGRTTATCISFVFPDEAAARVKFEELREVVVCGGGSDDLVWTELHAVAPGERVDTETRIDSH